MYIFVTTQFDALHCWPAAPAAQAFLRNPHRHLFKVRLEMYVEHDDRELEFFDIQFKLEQIIKAKINISDAGSCEQIAKIILTEMFKVHKRRMGCEVSEDGENGAMVGITDGGTIL